MWSIIEVSICLNFVYKSTRYCYLVLLTAAIVAVTTIAASPLPTSLSLSLPPPFLEVGKIMERKVDEGQSLGPRDLSHIQFDPGPSELRRTLPLKKRFRKES
ncbi:hypothetical protein RIF29_20142 [Crotalaria pallida]|uniref:Uncharacterized protein n=1 Tax=Crotalaria pallida TaxID=3830 RepID=A0AAN9F936_CROPI